MVKSHVERRRYGRIRLDAPVRARFGDHDVLLIELSVKGFLIAHQSRVAPGDTNRLVVPWDGSSIATQCTVVRSTLASLAKKPGEQSVYQAGLEIVSFADGGFERLRQLIGERILRALDEMKANAHGLPPLTAYLYQPFKGDLYRRCERIDGHWRTAETMHPQQPPNGFTISAEIDPQHVELLCETWVQSSAEGRRLTQLMAELSISKAEGIPTRRYVP